MAGASTTLPDGLRAPNMREKSAIARAKAPSIIHFPLPRELRDQIYGYLLGAPNVLCTSEDGEPSRYKFETAILAVNSTVGGEAKENLLSNNKFILIKYDTPGLLRAFNNLDVPVVAKKNVEGFAYHSLELEFTWRARSHAKPICDSGCMLILRRDLGRCFAAIQVLYQYTRATAVYVCSDLGGPLVLRAVARADGPVLHITTNRCDMEAMVEQEQRKIPVGARGMLGCGYKLTLTGFADTEFTKRVRHSTSPDLIWLRAQQWDRLHTLLEMKREAETLTRNNAVSAVAARYDMLPELLDSNIAAKFRSLGVAKDEEVAFVAARWIVLKFDMRASRTAVNLKLGELEEAGKDVQVITKDPVGTAHLISDSVRGQLMWLIALYALLFEIDEYGYVARNNADRALSAFARAPRDIHSQHDHGVVTEALRVLAANDTIPLDATAFSVHVLPLRIYDNQVELQQEPVCCPPRPSTLTGWQNTAHLAQLSGEEKEMIRELRRNHGLRLTSFE